MIAETLIIHAGSLIEWRDGSGYVDKVPKRITPTAISITFFTPPQSLRVLHKPNGTLLWHKDDAEDMHAIVVAGSATAADLTLPAAAPVEITGSVADPSGQYLPRRFHLTLGTVSEHTIPLYLSPLGARFSKAGGIYGKIHFDDASVAAWALLHLTVTPSLGGPLSFIAQADAQGEFRMPLDRLPALTKDAPASTYSASLTIKAQHAASPAGAFDPDLLPGVKIATGKDGNGITQFANSLSLAITPGGIKNVVSPAHTHIELKST